LIESYVSKVFKSNSPNLVGDILRAVDKIQKKKKDEIIKEYQEKGYSISDLEKILEFSKIKGAPEEIERKLDVKELKNWDKLRQLFTSLKNRHVENIRINFGIVRGLDYYSGIVFEAFDSTSDLGALVGGGRYDNLTKAFGREDLGATGVAGGVERIVYSLEKQGIDMNIKTSQIWIVYILTYPKASLQLLMPFYSLQVHVNSSRFLPQAICYLPIVQTRDRGYHHLSLQVQVLLPRFQKKF